VRSIDEELLGDGHSCSPKALHSWLTRVMYNRRSKMNPLWNTVVIGGVYGGTRWAGLHATLLLSLSGEVAPSLRNS